jgi:predicted short-subunit dehydrogenase-like oxidoreductase (DUF2520 family)
VVTKPQEIVIIGAGRLATHLGLAFLKNGLIIKQVCNRTHAMGMKLANRLGASFTTDIRELTPDASVYILAVSDSFLEQLAGKLNLKNKLVIHTSGAVEMGILESMSKNIGVFYPVQSFSPGNPVDFRKIPVCIEGNSNEVEQKLTILAKTITNSIHYLDSDQRRLLHLAAVFSANFTNFMYAVSEELLLETNIPFDLLKPLIMQTARNTRYGNLFQCQTGPAVRGDAKVLETHRALLAGHPDYLEIYNMISHHIIRHKTIHGKL